MCHRRDNISNVTYAGRPALSASMPLSVHMTWHLCMVILYDFLNSGSLFYGALLCRHKDFVPISKYPSSAAPAAATTTWTCFDKFSPWKHKFSARDIVWCAIPNVNPYTFIFSWLVDRKTCMAACLMACIYTLYADDPDQFILNIKCARARQESDKAFLIIFKCAFYLS